MVIVRVVLALASIYRWTIQQPDVNNAFLHGDLSEDVYITIPPGVFVSGSSKCCKLHKSLYGLKQSNRKWYEKLFILLLSCGYQQAQADRSLFVKTANSDFTDLIVYVDDIILTDNSTTEMVCIKHVLHSNFHIKYLGILKYFLDIEVVHSEKGIHLCQRKYCLDLLRDSRLLGYKPCFTPMDNSLRQDDSELYTDVLSYQRLVGLLLYLITTRLDISFTTQQLSQFMSKPTRSHFVVAMRVLKYLKGCPGRGLFFPRDSQLQLTGFSDADWGICIDSRRFITCYCFFIESSLISWKINK